jgi:hypothetical protein
MPECQAHQGSKVRSPDVTLSVKYTDYAELFIRQEWLGSEPCVALAPMPRIASMSTDGSERERTLRNAEIEFWAKLVMPVLSVILSIIALVLVNRPHKP